MSTTGTVKWFNHAKGYGFLKTADGSEVFVHHNDIFMSGYRYLRRGQQVEFELQNGPDGPKAVHVVVTAEASEPSKPEVQPEPVTPKSAMRPGYQLGQRLVVEEDREHEFKSLSKSTNPVRTIAEYYIEKYVNAFLNTRGGVILFGIDDDGVVQGITLDRTSRDQLRTEISRLIQKFQPSVEPDLYQIKFIPVEGKGDLFVVEIHVSKGTANLYMSGSQNFFIRRDGSNFLMSFDMIRRRLQTDPVISTPVSKPDFEAEPSPEEELDLGILLAMVFMSWSDERLSENEQNLLESRARDEGLEESEIRLLHEAKSKPPLLNTIVPYLPTKEASKAAATIAYLTALSDSVVTDKEKQAFEKMCDALGLSDEEREDILQLGEQRIGG